MRQLRKVGHAESVLCFTAILQTPFCMRGLTIQNRVFYEWKQKILDGHLPVIPQPRFLHYGFRQPLALSMRKKKRLKAFPSLS